MLTCSHVICAQGCKNPREHALFETLKPQNKYMGHRSDVRAPPGTGMLAPVPSRTARTRITPFIKIYLVNFREFKIGGNKFIENYYKLIKVQDFNEI